MSSLTISERRKRRWLTLVDTEEPAEALARFDATVERTDLAAEANVYFRSAIGVLV